MIRVDINPLSVNAAWLGRRRKTPKCRDYEVAMLELRDDCVIPEEGDLFILYEWGLSNVGFDIDNPIKPFQDILQTRYGFNDKRIVTMLVNKYKVKKGEEFVQFSVHSRDNIRVEVVDLNTQEVVHG